MAPVLTSQPSSSSSSLLEPSLTRGSAQIKNYPDQLRSTAPATSPPAQDPPEVVRLDSLRHSAARLDARNYKHSSFVLELLEILRKLHIPAWSQDTRLKPQDVVIRKVSGALTNAVFFVSCHTLPSLRTLLLRIYGPSSGSLISRPRELRILHVLSSRYKIGPRVYGTFSNGRIEEYFDSVTLTPPDIRNPEISRWIGARMAELHSVDIPTVEGPDWRRKLAPYGFQIATNVKSWLDPAEDVLKLSCISDSTRRAFDLDRFKQEWQRYLDWATSKPKSIGKRRVFGHNDAQYGNLLRLNDGKHELALAEHRQIIVVDFEYAAPNPAAYDIANHFHEWSANYHGPNPHLLDPSLYPTLEQRRNFYAAYIQHGRANNSDDGPVGEGNSPFTIPAAMRSSSSLNLSSSATGTTATDRGSTSVAAGATGAAGGVAATEEEEGGKSDDALIDELEEAVQVWSPASHAGWAIWGIVQARDDLEAAAATVASASTIDPSAPASSSPAPAPAPTTPGDTPSQPPTSTSTEEEVDPKCNSKTVASELPATTLAPSSTNHHNNTTTNTTTTINFTNPACSDPRPAATTTTIQSEIRTPSFGISAVSTGTTIVGSDEPNKLRAFNHGEEGGRRQRATATVTAVVGVSGGGGNSGAADDVVSNNLMTANSSNGRNGCDGSGVVQVGVGGGVGGGVGVGGCGVDEPAQERFVGGSAPSSSGSASAAAAATGATPTGVPDPAIMGRTCCAETAAADFDYIGYAYGRMLAFRRDLERLGI